MKEWLKVSVPEVSLFISAASTDGKLYVVSGEHLCLVLRSRLQVQAALLDYHNELNHLDVNKCLRLLNERFSCSTFVSFSSCQASGEPPRLICHRFFWKSMRLDVVQWINSCALCSRKSRKRPHARSVEPQTLQQALRSPQLFSERCFCHISSIY